MRKTKQTVLAIGLSRSFGAVIVTEHEVGTKEGKKGFHMGAPRIIDTQNVRSYDIPALFCDSAAPTMYLDKPVVIKVAGKEQELIGKVIPLPPTSLKLSGSNGLHRSQLDVVIDDIDAVIVVVVKDQKMQGTARIEQRLDSIQANDDGDDNREYYLPVANFNSAEEAYVGAEQMFIQAMSQMERFRKDVASAGFVNENQPVSMVWDKDSNVLMVSTVGETKNINESEFMSGLRATINRNHTDFTKRAELLQKQKKLSDELAQVNNQLQA
ncbi:hypothetical protein RYA05_03655 [Pseudomonas syringae pv. actinidiae]|nr:hypothetical protein [Pseudomonas syringae pv. actinidiae]